MYNAVANSAIYSFASPTNGCIFSYSSTYACAFCTSSTLAARTVSSLQYTQRRGASLSDFVMASLFSIFSPAILRCAVRTSA